MPLSILTDDEISGLLENLTADELEAFRDSLKSALHDYSTGTQAEDGEIHQPHRTVTRSSLTGATTLFMPSCSPSGLGVKGERERETDRERGRERDVLPSHALPSYQSPAHTND